MKVCVIGAGVIGAAVAWHASRRAGCDVTVVDAGIPAASNASFGWINASFYLDEHHHALRTQSMAAYGRLLSALPDAPINLCGALWWEEQGQPLEEMQARLSGLAYEVTRLTREECAQLEPDLRGVPRDLLRFPREGAADVGLFAQRLLAASGARILRGVAVHALEEESGRTRGVQTSLGMIEADHVVVAAGNGAPDILASVGVDLPMLKRPGVLVTTKPVQARIKSILVTPHGEARQLANGGILASAAANHQSDDASEVSDHVDDIAARVLGWVGPLVGEDVTLDTLSLANRPMPADSFPVIGEAGPKGLHVAVMHSGVTLAAITGEIIAAQITGQLSNSQTALIAPYSPARF